MAQGCGSTNKAQRRLCKNDRGPKYPSVAEQVRLVSSLLYGTRTKPVCFEFASFHHQIYAAFTISLETVRMAKHALSKNKSGRLDLPQDCLDDHNTRHYTVSVKSVM